jgi:hypothetical protein
MKPDAIIVRASRLQQGMFCAPLGRLGAGFYELADSPMPIDDGSHVCLREVDGAIHHAHSSVLYVALVDSEEPTSSPAQRPSPATEARRRAGA